MIDEDLALDVDTLQGTVSTECITSTTKKCDGLVTDVQALDTCAIQNGVENSVTCRICQEEDYVKNLESPCGCKGSIKYVHSKCVQRWCDEKRDTICEICHQQYQHGYRVSPQSEHISSPLNGQSEMLLSGESGSELESAFEVASSQSGFQRPEEFALEFPVAYHLWARNP